MQEDRIPAPLTSVQMRGFQKVQLACQAITAEILSSVQLLNAQETLSSFSGQPNYNLRCQKEPHCCDSQNNMFRFVSVSLPTPTDRLPQERPAGQGDQMFHIQQLH